MTIAYLPKRNYMEEPMTDLQGANRLLDTISTELDQEIERGNDLCVIIYKLIRHAAPNGEGLLPHEIERIHQILSNLQNRKG